MSDREDRRAKRGIEQQSTIPDGGLSSSMPAWLTERPRWTTEPAQETPPSPKQLPPADESRIELSSILDVADLPGWLQDVARRAERRVATATPATTAAIAVEPERQPAIDVTGEPEPLARTVEPDATAFDLAEKELAIAEVPADGSEIEAVQSDDATAGEEPPEVDSPGFTTAGEQGSNEPVEPDSADDVTKAESNASGAAASEQIGKPGIPIPGGLGQPRTANKDQQVDWAAVRQEAVTSEREAVASEREAVAANNPLLAKNPPVRVEPTTVRERPGQHSSSNDRPWWMSDVAIGVLLVAFILTMVYVILVASGVL